MNKLKWWLRIVGGFYLLLGLTGLGYFLLLPRAMLQTYAATLPWQYSGDPLAVSGSHGQGFPRYV